MVELIHYMPAKVYFGDNSIEVLGEEARRLGTKALFVTTNRARVARKTGYYDKIMELLKSSGLSVYEYIEVEHDPPIDNVMRAVELFKDKGVDLIVAFGGGSALDAGKAIAVGLSLGDVRRYVFPNMVEEEVIPVIAIPTTCGTGSEVTRYSILTDKAINKKVALTGYPIIPRVAIVDPLTLKTLPGNLTAWTGFDALSHALEAYLSRKSNPLIEPIALEAAKLVVDNIVEAYKGSMNAKRKLHLASTMAGLAINTAGTTMVHGLGYYLTTHHGVHHGLANAVYLPFVLKYNLENIDDRKVSKLLKTFNTETVDEFLSTICRTLDATGIPSSLAELGLSQSELEAMVRNALEYRRNMENNPVEVNEETLRTVILSAFKGRDSICRA